MSKKAWYDKNRAAILSKCRERNQSDRYKLIQKLGGACVFCGEQDFHVLDVDHIKSDGYIVKREGKSKSIVSRIKSETGIENVDRNRYQLLCKNCNWRKEKLKRSKEVIK